MSKKISEQNRIDRSQKWGIIFAASILFIITIICLAFSRLVDDYLLWLCLEKGTLKIYWQRRPIIWAQIPISPKYPLWIPLLPFAAGLADVLWAHKRISYEIRIRGKRIHHYQIGMASTLVGIILAAVTITSSAPSVIWLDWKRTSVAEILQGLSVIMVTGGILLTLLDAEDLAERMRRIKKGLEKIHNSKRY